MEIKVAKFGGTSLSDAKQMQKAADIVRADGARFGIVVSAPGRRTPEDEKITDLLYRCFDGADDAFEAGLASFAARMDAMLRELSLPLDFSGEYARMQRAKGDPLLRDYFVSRGEFCSAQMMSACLDAAFADAADLVFFDAAGAPDRARTHDALQKLSGGGRFVMPGFYGTATDRRIRVFSRGGSDISGALAAEALGASVYENFTDVSGFLLADPKMVDKSKKVSIISYKELRRLAVLGAEVLHEDAVLPVREAEIPIHLLNTNRPEDEGTWIVPQKREKGTVSGIAGKAGFSRIVIEKDGIGENPEAHRALTALLARARLPVFGMPHAVDAVALLVRTEALSGREDAICAEISRAVSPASVRTEGDLALVCVIGEALSDAVSSALLRALAALPEKPLVLDGGADDLGMTFGVRSDRLVPTVRALYDALQGIET